VNEQEVRERFFERLEHLGPEAAYELRHPDYVMEMAQSGERIFEVAMIVEFRDGKIWRDTRYYAEPFEAPDWRAQWVERMEGARRAGELSSRRTTEDRIGARWS
jgi:hypothetical protein